MGIIIPDARVVPEKTVSSTSKINNQDRLLRPFDAIIGRLTVVEYLDVPRMEYDPLIRLGIKRKTALTMLLVLLWVDVQNKIWRLG